MNDAASRGKRLFSELRRRRIFRTAALYIIGTWLVLQVADVVFPALDIPEQAIRDEPAFVELRAEIEIEAK